MVVNDLAAVGASPLSVGMFLAAGSAGWFRDEPRWRDLLGGWRSACMRAQCVWGPGETQILQDVLRPDTFLLAGSGMGIIAPEWDRIVGDIAEGDVTLLLPSSGIHANGITLARRVAARLPRRYCTPLPDGQLFGEALLESTVIYAPLVEACQAAGIFIRYAVHITGHGWRKLMRARTPFVYVIDTVPEPPPVFSFLQEHGPIDDREAYATFNMGAGYALIVSPPVADRALSFCRSMGVDAWRAGVVEPSPDGRKRVVIRPKHLMYVEPDSATE